VTEPTTDGRVGGTLLCTEDLRGFPAKYPDRQYHRLLALPRGVLSAATTLIADQPS
jgi:hypothetical protein